ncbi:hypothetical protein [Spiroplasma sp. AdecLV25b]|uniref:hypothetical protein n=1 Tax=Spiroplasma sp. AdecLV25b TaxID=3027162 RepID=UPI0027E10F3B|nr:hypothetical protein [Spiroplasma sp. AdecLV25b]
MSLTKFENDFLLDAKQKFEKEISSVLVDIDKSNKSLIVTFKNNDINLIKTYSLKNWDDNYQTWIDNFKVHLLAESNKKINVVDIPNDTEVFIKNVLLVINQILMVIYYVLSVMSTLISIMKRNNKNIKHIKSRDRLKKLFINF